MYICIFIVYGYHSIPRSTSPMPPSPMPPSPMPPSPASPAGPGSPSAAALDAHRRRRPKGGGQDAVRGGSRGGSEMSSSGSRLRSPGRDAARGNAALRGGEQGDLHTHMQQRTHTVHTHTQHTNTLPFSSSLLFITSGRCSCTAALGARKCEGE